MKSLVQNAGPLFKHVAGLFPEAFRDDNSSQVILGCSPARDNNKSRGVVRRTSGILYADAVNYTRMTGQDEIGTHLQLVGCLNAMKALIEVHDGRVAHFAGDAVLAGFKDAGSALHCAINIQLGTRQSNSSLRSYRRILFRIGVNVGNVIADRGDIYGNAVNLAARLEKLAYPGGICVSDSVRAELGQNPNFNFIALGRQYVKNVREPVDAFWIEFEPQQMGSANSANALGISTAAT